MFIFVLRGRNLASLCVSSLNAAFRSVLRTEQCSAHRSIWGLSGIFLLNIPLGRDRMLILSPLKLVVDYLGNEHRFLFTSLLSCDLHCLGVPKYGSASETFDCVSRATFTRRIFPLKSSTLRQVCSNLYSLVSDKDLFLFVFLLIFLQNSPLSGP